MRRSTANILATGLVAGLVGFATVSICFVLLDLASGRGFWFTPSLLGGVLFQGPTQTCEVYPVASVIAGYSAIHLLVFLALGCLAAWVFSLTAARPWFWSGALLLFIIVAIHLSSVVLIGLASVSDCFSLYYVIAATAVAAATMFGYLLKEHRGLLAAIARSEQ
jgi:hypothetical protein